jgi:NAD+ kinase
VTAPRVVVVVKRTPFSRYVEEENDPEVVRLIKRRDPSVAQWVRAHREHVSTLRVVERALKKIGARAWVLHGPRVVFDASDASLVVTVGGDGTLLAASHNVGTAPLLGVNSSPGSSVGFFCAAVRDNVSDMLRRAMDRKLPSVELTRLKVTINGRVASRRVLNEALFCHETPAAASRYILQYGRVREEQLSSGFWVGSAAGSTGVLRSAGGRVLPLSSKALQLVVREPFAGMRSPYRMTKVVAPNGGEIVAVSKMRDACLFLDGPFQRIAVRLGDRIQFAASEEPIRVLGITARRGRKH